MEYSISHLMYITLYERIFMLQVINQLFTIRLGRNLSLCRTTHYFSTEILDTGHVQKYTSADVAL